MALYRVRHYNLNTDCLGMICQWLKPDCIYLFIYLWFNIKCINDLTLSWLIWHWLQHAYINCIYLLTLIVYMIWKWLIWWRVSINNKNKSVVLLIYFYFILLYWGLNFISFNFIGVSILLSEWWSYFVPFFNYSLVLKWRCHNPEKDVTHIITSYVQVSKLLWLVGLTLWLVDSLGH